MNVDSICWFAFQSSNITGNESNRDDNFMGEDADISIESSFFIYQVLSTQTNTNGIIIDHHHNHNHPSNGTKKQNVIVVIDEMYRPGKGVAMKRNHYGIWRRNFNLDNFEIVVNVAADALGYVDSGSKQHIGYHDHDIFLKDVKKEGSLVVTDVDMWERRKDLTGIVLKTTSLGVCDIPLN